MRLAGPQANFMRAGLRGWARVDADSASKRGRMAWVGVIGFLGRETISTRESYHFAKCGLLMGLASQKWKMRSVAAVNWLRWAPLSYAGASQAWSKRSSGRS